MKNKDAILLSIIIPVYNAEKYLSACVDSIMNQNEHDIELILVDDGSTDKSGTICDEYAARYGAVQVIHQKNAGVAAARNAGLDAATGEYVLFMDNDDWMNKGGLSHAMKIIRETKADIIIHAYLLSGEGRTTIGNGFIDPACINGKSSEDVLNYFRTKRINVTAPWEYIFKREIALRNRIRFDSHQNGVDDSCFTPILFIYANSFYFNDQPLISWRMRPDSQGSSHKKKDFMIKMISTVDVLKKVLDVTTEKYKKVFLLYRIHKNIYSLLGPYYEYDKKDQSDLVIWYSSNKDLLKRSVRWSGLVHRISAAVFGMFYGTIFSYKLAVLKGYLYMIRYRK